MTLFGHLNSNFQPTWQPASWAAYESIRDMPGLDPKLFFHQGYLLIDRTPQSMYYTRINELFPTLFFQWFTRRDQSFNAYRRCRLEKAARQAASPDQMVYVGERSVHWQKGEQRFLDLTRHRIPDLIVEVFDTILISDLGKKKLYSALGLQEYWVVDIGGLQVNITRLGPDGRYYPSESSIVLAGLPAAVLEDTLICVVEEGGQKAIQWLQEHLSKYS